MTQDKRDYTGSYSEEGFWNKLRRFGRKAGRQLVEMALQLFYALKSSDTPLWAKTVIVGALGYFISPVDAIPDVIPVLGCSDDLAVMTAALHTVASCVTDEIRAKAAAQTARWFDCGTPR